MCADPKDPVCVAVAAAYCAQHPEDTGCELFLPRFERKVGEVGTLELVVPVEFAPVKDVEIVGPACECGKSQKRLQRKVLSSSVFTKPWIFFFCKP